MLQPKTLAAVLFLAVAAGAAYWQVTREDERAELKPPPSPLPSFAPSSVDELTIADHKTGTTVTFEKTGETWRLTAPLADSADTRNVASAIKQLADARVSARPAATSKSSWPKLGVGGDEALTATVRKAGADLAVVHLGPDGKHLRIGDDAAVYPVHGINRSMFARELRMWRSRAITTFDATQVASVWAVDADSRASAQRTPPAGPDTPEQWTLTVGQQLVGRLDPIVPAGVVARMQNLSAQDFADDQTLESAGLAAPRLTIKVTLTDGTEQSLLVGNDADDKLVYVGRAGVDRVWTLARNTLDSFARPPAQWRDKSIADLAPEAVTRISLQYDGERFVAQREADTAWTVVEPPGLVADAAKLDSLAAAMRNLRGVAIAVDADSKSGGFRKPTAVARFTAERSTVTLTIGAKADKLWHVKASGRDDVLLMADYMARRFMLTPSDLTKAAAK